MVLTSLSALRSQVAAKTRMRGAKADQSLGPSLGRAMKERAKARGARGARIVHHHHHQHQGSNLSNRVVNSFERLSVSVMRPLERYLIVFIL